MKPYLFGALTLLMIAEACRAFAAGELWWALFIAIFESWFVGVAVYFTDHAQKVAKDGLAREARTLEWVKDHFEHFHGHKD